MPQLVLCRFPGYKGSSPPFFSIDNINNNTPIHNFTDFIADTFISKPSQIIRSLSVSNMTLRGDLKHLDVDTYFEPVLMDVMYMGYCYKSDINKILESDGR